MAITQETLHRIGQPEGEQLEYKAVLPPAATVAHLMCSFANTNGGAIVLGVVEDGKEVVINGLSDEFHAVEITRKAIDLLSPPTTVAYDYVMYQGKRLFVIEVQRSSAEVSFGGKVYTRVAERTTLKQPVPLKAIENAGIAGLSRGLADGRKSCTGARAKLLDHYESVLRILDDLSNLLCPKGSSVLTDDPEGKILLRILFSSCADTFETFISDLLYEIYLARPEALKSDEQVKVKDVLACADMQEFIRRCAKDRVTRLQRGSVKEFIAHNSTMKSLNVFNATRIHEIEKILQIRHLYTHQNGVIDEKFRRYFPAAKLNDEYRMTVDEFLTHVGCLVVSVEVVDEAARQNFKLASFS